MVSPCSTIWRWREAKILNKRCSIGKRSRTLASSSSTLKACSMVSKKSLPASLPKLASNSVSASLSFFSPRLRLSRASVQRLMRSAWSPKLMSLSALALKENVILASCLTIGSISVIKAAQALKRFSTAVRAWLSSLRLFWYWRCSVLCCCANC